MLSNLTNVLIDFKVGRLPDGRHKMLRPNDFFVEPDHAFGKIDCMYIIFDKNFHKKTLLANIEYDDFDFAQSRYFTELLGEARDCTDANWRFLSIYKHRPKPSLAYECIIFNFQERRFGVYDAEIFIPNVTRIFRFFSGHAVIMRLFFQIGTPICIAQDRRFSVRRDGGS